MRILILLIVFATGACFADQIPAELSKRFKDAKYIYLCEVVPLKGNNHQYLKVTRVYKGDIVFAEKAFNRRMASKIIAGSLYLETWSEDRSYSMRVVDSKFIKINGVEVPISEIETYLANTFKP